MQTGVDQELAERLAVQFPQAGKPGSLTQRAGHLPAVVRVPARGNTRGPVGKIFLRIAPAGSRRRRKIVGHGGREHQIVAGHRIDFRTETVDVLLIALDGPGDVFRVVGIHLVVPRYLRVGDQSQVEHIERALQHRTNTNGLVFIVLATVQD